MAEENDSDKEQKTLDPSAKRLEDAYKKGQIPLSRDLNNFVFLVACLVICAWVLPFCCKKAISLFATFISMPGEIRIENYRQFSLVYANLVIKVIQAFWMPFAIISLAALAVGLGQTYRGISLENIQMKLSRISFSAGFKRVFSFQSVFETLKSIVKIILLCAIAYFTFKDNLHEINTWLFANPLEYASILRSLVVKFIGMILVGYALLSAFDVWYQRFHFRQNLRMTVQEMKEEHKESDGDPHLKGRIRELQRKRSRNRMLAKVPTSTVIVTNPTHYSVALLWQEEGLDAPIVVAKGADVLALKIREIAKENKVPIVENVTVARSLYDSVDIDQQIPPEYYKVVAEVIRTAMKIRRHQF
jgi:flagellar biosynthetic protein FlhB